MTCCDAANLTGCVLPEQDAAFERLANYRLVILAGVYHISESMHAVLTAYARQGGILRLPAGNSVLRLIEVY